MSDDDDDDEIPITLKYHGIQKKIDFNFDFNVLLGEAFERFKIDKTKYELRFYYYDEEQEKRTIDKNTDETTYRDIYKKSNKNLMIYVEEEEKKEIKKMESNNIYSASNVSVDFDDSLKKSESSSFYKEIDERANEQKVDSKTEENKEVNIDLFPKVGFEKKIGFPNMSEIHVSNISKKKNLDNIKNLKEIRNKNKIISRKKEELDSKNKELEKNIKDIKELIEKSKIKQEPYVDAENNDDKDLLIKLQIEKTKLENLEKEKLKEIEQIKDKNSKLQNMISTLSIKLEKQKEENSNLNLSEENSMKSFPELKDNNKEDMKSLKFGETAISQNGSLFFSNIIDIYQYFGKNGNNKEKKMKRIEKINKLYQKSKKCKIKIDDIKEKNIKNEENIFNSKIFEKQKLKKINIKKPKEQNENKSIKKENEELRDDIKDKQDKIFKVQKEIEDLKRLYEDERKKIQGEGD